MLSTSLGFCSTKPAAWPATIGPKLLPRPISSASEMDAYIRKLVAGEKVTLVVDAGRNVFCGMGDVGNNIEFYLDLVNRFPEANILLSASPVTLSTLVKMFPEFEKKWGCTGGLLKYELGKPFKGIILNVVRRGEIGRVIRDEFAAGDAYAVVGFQPDKEIGAHLEWGDNPSRNLFDHTAKNPRGHWPIVKDIRFPSKINIVTPSFRELRWQLIEDGYSDLPASFSFISGYCRDSATQKLYLRDLISHAKADNATQYVALMKYPLEDMGKQDIPDNLTFLKAGFMPFEKYAFYVAAADFVLCTGMGSLMLAQSLKDKPRRICLETVPWIKGADVISPANSQHYGRLHWRREGVSRRGFGNILGTPVVPMAATEKGDLDVAVCLAKKARELPLERRGITLSDIVFSFEDGGDQCSTEKERRDRLRQIIYRDSPAGVMAKKYLLENQGKAELLKVLRTNSSCDVCDYALEKLSWYSRQLDDSEIVELIEKYPIVNIKKTPAAVRHIHHEASERGLIRFARR